MPSRSATNLVSDFNGYTVRLDGTRKRAEGALKSGALRLIDVEAVYSGLFLQLVVAYEATLEKFVLGLVVRPGGVVSSKASVRGAFSVRSYDHALKLASGRNRDYADWINKEQVHSCADVFMRSNPFPPVGDQAWSYVMKARYIRNAIAHPSASAAEKFSRNVLMGTPLPPRERRVAGYLRGLFVGAPAQTRWELYAAELGRFVSTTVA